MGEHQGNNGIGSKMHQDTAPAIPAFRAGLFPSFPASCSSSSRPEQKNHCLGNLQTCFIYSSLLLFLFNSSSLLRNSSSSSSVLAKLPRSRNGSQAFQFQSELLLGEAQTQLSNKKQCQILKFNCSLRCSCSAFKYPHPLDPFFLSFPFTSCIPLRR